MRGRRRLGGAAGSAAVAACIFGFAASASAKTIDVHAGQSVQHAVHKAGPGDVIAVHPGTYRGSLLVDKRVAIEGVGKSRPVLDAQCDANDTIQVTHSGVHLKHLKVQGADEGFGEFPAEVFFVGVVHGKAKDLRVVDTCDAEYGISAFSTGPIKVTDNYGSGFGDSAIYIGTITDTLGGTLLVSDNRTVHNSRGILVEDSPKRTDILVQQNVMNRNTIPGSEGPSDGLFLHNSDGIAIVKNTADGNGYAGYHADENSDHNLFIGNKASGNSKAFVDDEGGGSNCGSANSFSIPSC
jgi:parallel beta-helix repeat protein